MASGRVIFRVGVWAEVVDARGRIYYFNRETKHTQWASPEEIDRALESDISNWKTTRDPITNRTYYYCALTGRSSWYLPGDSREKNTWENLQEDKTWSKYTCPRTKRRLWHHPISKETRKWDPRLSKSIQGSLSRCESVRSPCRIRYTHFGEKKCPIYRMWIAPLCRYPIIHSPAIQTPTASNTLPLKAFPIKRVVPTPEMRLLGLHFIQMADALRHRIGVAQAQVVVFGSQVLFYMVKTQTLRAQGRLQRIAQLQFSKDWEYVLWKWAYSITPESTKASSQCAKPDLAWLRKFPHFQFLEHPWLLLDTQTLQTAMMGCCQYYGFMWVDIVEDYCEVRNKPPGRLKHYWLTGTRNLKVASVPISQVFLRAASASSPYANIADYLANIDLYEEELYQKRRGR